MRMTSSEASKLIRQLKERRRMLEIQENEVVSFIAATVENIEDARPEYSYEKTASEYDIIDNKLRRIKHALNLFNTGTVLEGFDMTIDEMLLFLPQLSERINRLAAMLSKPAKSRVDKSVRIGIIEYEYLNYDLDTVRNDYEKLADLKSRALTALDLANNTLQFEVDI